jgi:hypothetical protein
MRLRVNEIVKNGLWLAKESFPFFSKVEQGDFSKQLLKSAPPGCVEPKPTPKLSDSGETLPSFRRKPESMW